MRRIYLDHTATTPVDARVLGEMTPFFADTFGNASSIHRFGQDARAALDESRSRLAGLIGAQEGEVVFVSGGTEADNHALKGVAWEAKKDGRDHIITAKAEHHAVLDTCEFLKGQEYGVTLLDVDGNGMVDPGDVAKAITPRTALISVMHVNNEVGTINPVGEIARIARDHGVPFHSDTVQSFGKLPVDADELGVDILSLSAHKIYGPKGIGILYMRRGLRAVRLIHGGGQERGRRAGTENIPLAVGFARAAEIADEERSGEWDRLTGLKGAFRAMLEERFPFIIFNGHPERSVPHILSISFRADRIDLDGESLLFSLDLAGIAAASGSACTSGSVEASHVLLAMGRDERTARASIRFSLGRGTKLEDLQYTADSLAGIVKRIGRVLP
jgi:cysteine desulfurase